MNVFDFSARGYKTLLKLPKEVQERIKKKLLWLKVHPNIFTIIEGLEDFEPATHRIRIGEYRLLLELLHQTEIDNVFSVLKVGHRRDIYSSVI